MDQWRVARDEENTPQDSSPILRATQDIQNDTVLFASLPAMSF